MSSILQMDENSNLQASNSNESAEGSTRRFNVKAEKERLERLAQERQREMNDLKELRKVVVKPRNPSFVASSSSATQFAGLPPPSGSMIPLVLDIDARATQSARPLSANAALPEAQSIASNTAIAPDTASAIIEETSSFVSVRAEKERLDRIAQKNRDEKVQLEKGKNSSTTTTRRPSLQQADKQQHQLPPPLPLTQQQLHDINTASNEEILRAKELEEKKKLERERHVTIQAEKWRIQEIERLTRQREERQALEREKRSTAEADAQRQLKLQQLQQEKLEQDRRDRENERERQLLAEAEARQQMEREKAENERRAVFELERQRQLLEQERLQQQQIAAEKAKDEQLQLQLHKQTEITAVQLRESCNEQPPTVPSLPLPSSTNSKVTSMSPSPSSLASTTPSPVPVLLAPQPSIQPNALPADESPQIQQQSDRQRSMKLEREKLSEFASTLHSRSASSRTPTAPSPTIGAATTITVETITPTTVAAAATASYQLDSRTGTTSKPGDSTKGKDNDFKTQPVQKEPEADNATTDLKRQSSKSQDPEQRRLTVNAERERLQRIALEKAERAERERSAALAGQQTCGTPDRTDRDVSMQEWINNRRSESRRSSSLADSDLGNNNSTVVTPPNNNGVTYFNRSSNISSRQSSRMESEHDLKERIEREVTERLEREFAERIERAASQKVEVELQEREQRLQEEMQFRQQELQSNIERVILERQQQQQQQPVSAVSFDVEEASSDASVTERSDSSATDVPVSSTTSNTHMSRSFSTNSYSSIGQVSYVGVIQLVESYIPPRSCREHMLDDLSRVMPQVNIAFITNECVNIAECRLERLPVDFPRLSPDEAIAVALYTYNLGINTTQQGEDNFYVQLNNVLRERDGELMQILRPYLCYLMRGLAKLPSYRGTVYRGVPRHTLDVVLSLYGLGASIHWSAFTSTTIDIEVAKRFAKAGGIIFHIKCHSGRSVCPYSHLQNESEILLSPNARFTVSSDCELQPDGYYKIEMVERVDANVVF